MGRRGRGRSSRAGICRKNKPAFNNSGAAVASRIEASRLVRIATGTTLSRMYGVIVAVVIDPDGVYDSVFVSQESGSGIQSEAFCERLIGVLRRDAAAPSSMRSNPDWERMMKCPGDLKSGRFLSGYKARGPLAHIYRSRTACFRPWPYQGLSG
jgi:hypothetical protein